MRYYRIVISDPVTGEIFVPNVNGKPGFTRQPANPSLSTYTSLNSGFSTTTLGGTNPAAPLVEMDIPVAALHSPVSNSFIKVWGVSLAEIGQASNLNHMICTIYGGMAKGLPLANPAQAGILAMGQVYSAFGNWLGTTQSLDIYLTPGGSAINSSQVTGQPGTTVAPASNAHPGNIIFTWKDGQTLISAIQTSLSTAFSQYSIQGQINPNLVLSGAPETGFFATIQQFARYVKDFSQHLISGYAPNPQAYDGVSISLQNNILSIQDGTVTTPIKNIIFTDLVGQPTWEQLHVINVTTVLRSDIQIGDYVSLPQGLINITFGANTWSTQSPSTLGSAYSSTKQSSIFQYVFLVQSVRHVGNSRDANATSWVTILSLVQLTTYGAVASQISALPVLYKGSSASS